MVVDVLPRWERYAYWIVGVSGMAYSVYALFLEGDKNTQAMLGELKPGWSWLGRYKAWPGLFAMVSSMRSIHSILWLFLDVSDTDWEVWKSSHTVKILATIAHVLVSQMSFYFKTKPQFHTYTLIMVDMVSGYMLLGGHTMVLLVCLALMMYLVCLVGKIWLVWMLAVTLMYHMNASKIYEIWMEFTGITDHLESFQYSVISGFFNIRLTSFGIEKVKYQTHKTAQTQASHVEQPVATSGISGHQKQPRDTAEADTESPHTNPDSTDQTKVIETDLVDADPSFSDLLLYSFYWPTFYSGPIFMYRDFHLEIKKAFCSQSFVPDICDILKQLIRIGFWGIFLEFQSHFLYHMAITGNSVIFEQVPYSVVVGIGYWHSQYFMIKYVLFYGVAIEMSRFDGISPLARPRCLSWVYTFSDIWKYFDVGLYNFTKTYIYVPLGGSRVGVCRQIFAAGLGFMFINFWHDLSTNSAIWFMGNYLINCLQAMACFAEKSDLGRTLKSRIGPAMYLRIKAVLCVPCYIMGCLSMSHFFFNGRIGESVRELLVTRASWTNIIAFGVVTTACVHNGLYIGQIYRQRKDRMTNTETKQQKQKSS